MEGLGMKCILLSSRQASSLVCSQKVGGSRLGKKNALGQNVLAFLTLMYNRWTQIYGLGEITSLSFSQLLFMLVRDLKMLLR